MYINMSHEKNGFPQEGAKWKDLFEIYHNCQTIIKHKYGAMYTASDTF